MDALDILASIEALEPSAREGWDAFIADVRSWGRTEALATSISCADVAVLIDRPSTVADRDEANPARGTIICRFARDADARHAAQLLRGYQAAVKAGA